MPDPVHVQRLQVLVVSADPAVVTDVRNHLAGARVGADLHHVEDNDMALAFLQHEGTYAESLPPGLTFVDLENPGAAALLQAIAEDPELERLPVVALTVDAEASADVLATFRLHDVVGKPPGPEGLTRVLSFLDEV